MPKNKKNKDQKGESEPRAVNRAREQDDAATYYSESCWDDLIDEEEMMNEEDMIAWEEDFREELIESGFDTSSDAYFEKMEEKRENWFLG